MEEKSWTGVDKSDWGEGPWHTEPDKLQWEDEQTGLPCLIVRSVFSGSLCGYVGVSPEHPFFGIGLRDCVKRSCLGEDCPATPERLIHGIHGSLTWASLSDLPVAEGSSDTPVPEFSSLACEPAPGEEHEVWWFGFDCGHGFDVCPAMEARLQREVGDVPFLADLLSRRHEYQTYRTIDFVKSHCRRLALQLDDRDWHARLDEIECRPNKEESPGV